MPTSVEVPDGNDFTSGSKGDSAATDSTSSWSKVALLKGLLAKLTGIVQTADIEQQGYIAFVSPPAQTNAGSDTPLTFSQQVNRITVQNNTSGNVNIACDSTASPGSTVLLPGAFYSNQKKCTVFHLYTATPQNINGSTAGNIVVLGSL